MARRIAARYIGANDEQTSAIPQSAPGKSMMKKQLDELLKAFESGDQESFGKKLSDLQAHHERVNG